MSRPEPCCFAHGQWRLALCGQLLEGGQLRLGIRVSSRGAERADVPWAHEQLGHDRLAAFHHLQDFGVDPRGVIPLSAHVVHVRQGSAGLGPHEEQAEVVRRSDRLVRQPQRLVDPSEIRECPRLTAEEESCESTLADGSGERPAFLGLGLCARRMSKRLLGESAWQERPRLSLARMDSLRDGPLGRGVGDRVRPASRVAGVLGEELVPIASAAGRLCVTPNSTVRRAQRSPSSMSPRCCTAARNA